MLSEQAGVPRKAPDFNFQAGGRGAQFDMSRPIVMIELYTNQRQRTRTFVSRLSLSSASFQNPKVARLFVTRKALSSLYALQVPRDAATADRAAGGYGGSIRERFQAWIFEMVSFIPE